MTVWVRLTGLRLRCQEIIMRMPLWGFGKSLAVPAPEGCLSVPGRMAPLRCLPLPPLTVGVHPGQRLDGPLRCEERDPFVWTPLDVHNGAGVLLGQQVHPE